MLYKYLHPDRVDVIERLEIRFTQPNALNDPFDLRPRFESLIPESEALANYSATPVDFAPIMRQAYSMLPDDQRSRLSYEEAASVFKAFLDTHQARSAVSAGLIMFLRLMRNAAAPLCESLYEALNRGIGILSLTEIRDDPVMWVHYADSHRGLLIGFSEEHLFFNRRRSENDEFYFLRKVSYADLPPAPSAFTLDGNGLFVSKGQKWAYEREWRMLAPLQDASRTVATAGEPVHLYEVPPDALTSVVIGARTGASVERRVRDILHTNPDLTHVSVSRAVLDLQRQRIQLDCPR
jgi:hypothetical protein